MKYRADGLHGRLPPRGPFNPPPKTMDIELLLAFIDHRPYCLIRCRMLVQRA